MIRVHIDFETRSECDLGDCGAWIYSRHPTTSILCTAFAIDDQEVNLLRMGETETCATLKWLAKSPAIFVAHNAFFEQVIWQNILVEKHGFPPLPPDRWACTAAKANRYAIPRSLEKAAEALQLESGKDKEGHKVMLRLTKPKAPSKSDPSKWDNNADKFEALYSYCTQDVHVERQIDKLLPELSDTERLVWLEDQRMKLTGIRVDTDLVDAAIYLSEKYAEEMNAELDALTDGKVQKVSKITDLKKWIESHNIEVSKLDKVAVRDLLAKDNVPSPVQRALYIRQKLGKSSVAKYQKLRHQTDKDARIRGFLAYHRASTGRWGGQGVQLQNLPRLTLGKAEQLVKMVKTRDLELLDTLYGDPLAVISQAIRGAFLPSEGRELIVADYSAIETRVLFWLAGETEGLAKFHRGEDLYVDMARVIFGDPTLTKANFFERQVGKEVVLGCGYQMGWSKFLQTCLDRGLDIDVALAQKAVETYRDVYDKVRSFWYGIEASALTAVREKRVVDCGKVRFAVKGNFLLCRLPSGRTLSYPYPVIMKPTDKRLPKPLDDDDWRADKDVLTYTGENVAGQHVRISTYGGKLVENVTQATARDLLAEALVRVAKDSNLVNLLTVHDEIVAEAKVGSSSVERLVELMCASAPWAKDCPVAAEGWKGDRYGKG